MEPEHEGATIVAVSSPHSGNVAKDSLLERGGGVVEHSVAVV